MNTLKYELTKVILSNPNIDNKEKMLEKVEKHFELFEEMKEELDLDILDSNANHQVIHTDFTEKTKNSFGGGTMIEFMITAGLITFILMTGVMMLFK